MKITAVCIGAAGVIAGKTARTGIVKQAVGGAVIVDAAGLAGDAVCNVKHHGGPDQAVYALGSIDLDGWADELGFQPEPGLLGENLVIEGVDSRIVSVGDRFETASVTLEVTATRMPCSTLSVRMKDAGFARRFNRVARPGFYCRVLVPGILRAGDAVAYNAYAGPRLTMPELLAKPIRRLSDDDRRRYLAAPISVRLRVQLARGDGGQA
jgi:MOSC domain-containing protein YiiM